MKQLTLIAMLLAGFVGAFAQEIVQPKPAPENALRFTIRTNKARYTLGETVAFTMTWQNISQKDFEMPLTPSMDQVSVFDQETKKQLQYHGMIACGGISYKTLAAGEKFEIRSVLNNFIYPDYDLTKPGRYAVRSGYSDNGSSAEVGASATFEIIRFDESRLAFEREKAVAGDKNALQILAAHGDDKIVMSLAELIKSGDEETRQTVYQALLMLNTENSMRLLAETATTNLPPLEKMNILRPLYEMKPEPNPVIIFYLQKLLNDNWVNGTMTTQNPNEPPKTYKLYTIRKYAYLILKRLNIESQVVYDEEVKEEAVNNKLQKN